MIKAIETRYKGYRFRSRLEARWAVFFDALGVAWEYEPEGYNLGVLGLYLPDFFVNNHTWIEVKAKMPTSVELSKLGRVMYHTAWAGYVLIGSPGEESMISPNAYPADGNGFMAVGEIGRNRDEDAFIVWSVVGNLEIVETDRDITFSEKGKQKVLTAYAAARSARFEHGEMP